MDERRSGDQAVRGIAERSHGRAFNSYFETDGQHTENRVCMYALQEFRHARFQREALRIDEQGDFKTRDGADRQRLTAPDRGFQHVQLRPREPAGFEKPPDQDVGVQQQPWRQNTPALFFSGPVRHGFPQVRCVEVHNVADDLPFSSPAIARRFQRGAFHRTDYRDRPATPRDGDGFTGGFDLAQTGETFGLEFRRSEDPRFHDYYRNKHIVK